MAPPSGVQCSQSTVLILCSESDNILDAQLPYSVSQSTNTTVSLVLALLQLFHCQHAVNPLYYPMATLQ